jgi:hypothetical protein
MRIRPLRLLGVTSTALLSLAAVSCGGGGGGGPDQMVLVGFNLPNIAGVPLNSPLIFTFSADVDPQSVTPDTIQVVGSPSFTFETIRVDGNLVAELPFIPNFEDFSDSGLAPATQYSVSLPTFPAVDTVRSTNGLPLVMAESFTFVTSPSFTFIEVRRPIDHSPGPITDPDGRGDDDGCINNPDNDLFDELVVCNNFQFGPNRCTDPAYDSHPMKLLCLKNEGPPRVLPENSIPKPDQRGVGTPSAVAPGLVDLGAIRVRFNEPLDPTTVVPYVPTSQLSLNVQLWRVGDTDANPLPPVPGPIQIKTNKPVVVQNLEQTEAILVATKPELQGTYLINILGLRDLAGNPIVTSDKPDPAEGGYALIDAGLVGKVPPGYRIYFRTLEIPATAGSFTESFGNNFREGTTDLFTSTTPPANPLVAIPASPATGAAGFTLTQAQPGQATTANWNMAYRWLGLSGGQVNTNVDDGAGRLKAVYAPYLGDGDDGSPSILGFFTLNTDGGSVNADGIWEFENLIVPVGATLRLVGTRPFQALVRGTCQIDGIVDASGLRGGYGIDTDGSPAYENFSGIRASGVGGAPGAGGGRGGSGSPANPAALDGTSHPGGGGVNLFGEVSDATTVGMAGLPGDGTNSGGGGGGYGSAGTGGSNPALNGAAWGNPVFTRALSLFLPDRTYQPGGALAGGTGGGGGGPEDDDEDSETGDATIFFDSLGHMTAGDDAGAGGGGGGGGIWISADVIVVNGTVRADGGVGGNTFGPGEHAITDPDVDTADDEFVSGLTVAETSAGTGSGGAGGGGSGGGILFQARTSLTVSAGATMSVLGGLGGTTLGNLFDGGEGGDGRIALLGFASTSDSGVSASVSVTGTMAVGSGSISTGATWSPTVDLTSQGVSSWLDMVTPTARFSKPFFDDNFTDLVNSHGLVRGLGSDFEAFLEFQAADTIPPGASGVTAWVAFVPDPGDPNLSLLAWPINNKQWIRWRWRFFTRQGYPASTAPMPSILDFTIPFAK